VILVALSASVLSGFAIRSLWARRRFVVGAVLGLVAVGESLAAPLPLAELPPAGVYAHVVSDPSAAAVLAVPFGVRDGFGERGRVEPDAIFQQTRHRHPMVGGFLARLPPSVGAWYENHEPFATLLRSSAGNDEPTSLSCETIRAGLQSANVGWVVVYADASGPLWRLVAAFPVEPVDADDFRTLYRVTRCPMTLATR
jgi:hypothetical protein